MKRLLFLAVLLLGIGLVAPTLNVYGHQWDKVGTSDYEFFNGMVNDFYYIY